MRSLSIAPLACNVLIIAATAVAGPPQVPPRDEAGEFPNPGVPAVAVTPLSDNEIAGLPRAVGPEGLTCERVYALALVRARTRRGAFLPTLDPAALADLAARQGVADFARFRTDFSAVGTFRDPGPAFLELQGRLVAIDNARRSVAVHESLMPVIVERSQGSNSGLNRIDIDTVLASMMRTRQKLDDEIGQFRGGLDELRFRLGLSPRAPVVLDRQIRDAFSAGFNSVENWAARPNRRVAGLYRLIDQFPAPGEIVVNGEPILEKVEKNPDRWEEVLVAAAQVAFKSRTERDRGVAPPNSGVQLELRVRRQIRSLFDKRHAYEREKRLYELAVRLRDQAFERVLAPPGAVASPRSQVIAVLVEQISQVLLTQNRLVELWTSFRAERLSLYHDLGVLPYENWNAFHADLRAVPPVAGAMPEVQPKPGADDASRVTPPVARPGQ